MAVKNRTLLTANATQITDETVLGANTKTRVGSAFQDLADSAFVKTTDTTTDLTEGTTNKFMTGANILALTGKTTPIDADLVPLTDTADTNALKKLTWANIKATLKTYFDGLYQAVLVSGTSIKTVNGNSLLGGGGLVTTTTAEYDDTSDIIGEVGIGQIVNVTYSGNGNGNGKETYIRDFLGNAVPISGYYEYVAILTQTDTSAPVATVIKNTLPQGLPAWSRTDVGAYLATLTSAFTANKTVIFEKNRLIGGFAEDIANYEILQIDSNTIQLNTRSANLIVDDSTPVDGLLGNFIISIRVYI